MLTGLPPAFPVAMYRGHDSMQDDIAFVDRQHGSVTSASGEHHEEKQIGGSGS